MRLLDKEESGRRASDEDKKLPFGARLEIGKEEGGRRKEKDPIRVRQALLASGAENLCRDFGSRDLCCRELCWRDLLASGAENLCCDFGRRDLCCRDFCGHDLPVILMTSAAVTSCCRDSRCLAFHVRCCHDFYVKCCRDFSAPAVVTQEIFPTKLQKMGAADLIFKLNLPPRD